MPSIFPSIQPALPSCSPERPVLSWIIFTGEYPPQPGGVGDYTRLVARTLAAAGNEVQVWAPPISGRDEGDAGVAVHRLADHFGLRSLLVLSRALKGLTPKARILVQYVPQAFGWKGMNLPFCFWLWMQRRRCFIIVMFHEVATPWGDGFGLREMRRNVLAAITRVMAFFVAHSARRIFGSIPAWKKMLRPLIGKRTVEWLPVPSNIPNEVDLIRVAKLRRELLNARSVQFLVGHFGTFGGHIADGLRIVLPRILAQQPAIAILLIGRGCEAFAQAFRARWPELGDRLIATGLLPAEAVSEHLSACDLLVQPYADGVSSRRTSVMAGLALGKPIVTTNGFLSEAVWKESGAVCLANSFEEMADQVGPLLANSAERARLGTAAAALYRERFHIDRTVAALRSNVASAAAGPSAG